MRVLAGMVVFGFLGLGSGLMLLSAGLPLELSMLGMFVVWVAGTALFSI